jgi:DNA-binding transcriptional LysR family regulator
VESPHRQRVVQLFARHHVPLRMDIEMPTIESIKLFVEMKKGIAIVPRMCVGPEIEQGILRELPMKQMKIQRRLYLIYRQDRPLTAAAQSMVELLAGKEQRKPMASRKPS